MKKILLIVLAAFIATAVIIVASASLQPSEYRVERSVNINASAEKIYAVTSDLRRFVEWSPFVKLDPNAKIEVTGDAGSVGQVYTWEGNDQAGSGRMTVTGVDPGRRVDITIEFLKPWEATASIAWISAGEGSQTLQTWLMTGHHNGLLAKAFSMVADFDAMLGKDFDEGLAKLKHLSEN